MQITSLMENTSGRPDCAAEHGLSLYIEANGHKILFDAGPSGKFIDNAQLLGVNLADVDMAVLSHGHYDHAGGMPDFFRVNQKAKLYASRRALLPHYGSLQDYNGVSPTLKDEPRLVPLDGDIELAEGVRLVNYQDRPLLHQPQSLGMTEELDGRRIPDLFLHEQYLVLTEGSSRVLISGCSHRGIRNLAHWAAEDGIQTIVGGFHFFKMEQLSLLDEAARDLLSCPIQYYTCHCTGAEQYAYLKEKMGDRLHYLAAGDVITI